MTRNANRAARRQAGQESSRSPGQASPRDPRKTIQPQPRRWLLAVSALLLAAWIVFLAVMAGLARDAK